MLLFDEWDAAIVVPQPTVEVPTNPNPCVVEFGLGPAGRKCEDCVHLKGFQQSATWYKCEKRQWKTKGGKYPGTIYPGGDHRVRYQACALFEERKEEDADE